MAAEAMAAAAAAKVVAAAKAEAEAAAKAEAEAAAKAEAERWAAEMETRGGVEAQAKACNERLGMANRLVGGLASENVRWGIEIDNLKRNAELLTGDVMLSAAFVSYVGAFGSGMRIKLYKDNWIEDLRARGIPLKIVTAPAAIRDLYQAPFTLIRPDQYVCWRGETMPDNQVWETVTGQ